MELDENLVIWIVDENVEELRLYQRLLQHAFKELEVSIDVKQVPARKHIGDYHDIIGDPRTAAIIVDQQLNEAYWTDHTGIQLAKRLRPIVDRLPIYILTSYAQSADFEGSEGSVEDILSKGDMRDPDKLKTILERLIRRIDVHQKFLRERDNRFRELLKKSLTEELSQEEKNELDDLQFERTAVTLSDEQSKLGKLETALKRLENLKSSYSDE